MVTRLRRLSRVNGATTAGSLAAAIIALLLLPQRVVGDDAVRRVMLEQLAHGVRPETKFSFIQPVVSLPVFWLLDKLRFGIYAVTLLPITWLIAWSLAVWKVLARVRSPQYAHHVVVLTVASMVGASLIGFSSDVFTALCMSGGLIVGLLAARPTGRVVAWTVFVIGAANTPVMFVATAIVAIFLVVWRRRLRYAALPVAVVLLMVIEVTAVTGSLGWTRYTRAVEHGEVPLLPWGDVRGFGWPLWSGALAVIFSFGRGVFFFIPTVWNGISRDRSLAGRAEEALWVLSIALVPVYSMWWAWYGGVSFGPRFFIIAVVPAAMATSSLVCRPDRGLLRSAVALLSVLLSGWVAVSGAVFGVTDRAFDWCASGGGFNNFVLCLYTPEYSALWAPVWIGAQVGRRGVLFAVVIVVLIAPTLAAIVRPCGAPLLERMRRLRAHVGGEWDF